MDLSKAGRAAVESAIEAAERKTSGEIVAVIAASSGEYFYVPFLWAALTALAFPWPLIIWTWLPVQTIFLLQLGLFGGLAALLHIEPLRLRLVPRGVKRRTAHRKAVDQFLAQNLHTTPGHTGVLLFVSEAERYVEIIADTGIGKAAPDRHWHSVVANLTAHLGRGNLAEGLVEAVGQIGDQLAVHFPASPNVKHVLPNHLVILRPS